MKIFVSKTIYVLSVLFCLTASVRAHDYWLEPEQFFVRENSLVNVRMWLGSSLVVEEERPFQLKRTPFLKLFSAQNEIDLLLNIATNEEIRPAVNLRVGAAGNYLLAMERAPSFLALESEKFHDYLREEGLEKIIAEREQAGETKSFGRERYRRYLKTLLQSGNQQDETFRKRTNLKLEIIPLENPSRQKPGAKLGFQVLFDGQPLKNALLFALNRQNNNQIFAQKFRTDEKGTAFFNLDKKGFWLIRTVTMQRCTENCRETDWDSYWAAFSFAIK